MTVNSIACALHQALVGLAVLGVVAAGNLGHGYGHGDVYGHGGEVYGHGGEVYGHGDAYAHHDEHLDEYVRTTPSNQ